MLLSHHVIKTTSPSQLLVGTASSIASTAGRSSVHSSSYHYRGILHSTRQQSTWATAANARSTQRSSSSLRQHHRPLVNGQTVPFHVSDLLPPPQSSSKLQQPKKRHYDNDLIVVLDMDECLIHSQFHSSSTAAKLYAHQLLQQPHANNNNTTNTTTENKQNQHQQQQYQPVDSFRFSLPNDGDLVHVNVRPGLQSFLEQVTRQFETHIFTAAMAVYADPLLNHLDPTNTLFAGRHYRDSCTYDAARGAHVKDLTRVFANANLQRIVLVDNNPLSFLANPENGILVSSFYKDPADTTLASVLELLTNELADAVDVRPHLTQRFALPTALSELVNNKQDSGSAAQQPDSWQQRTA
jgi:Dullard-like phosphatase family protein